MPNVHYHLDHTLYHSHIHHYLSIYTNTYLFLYYNYISLIAP